MSATYSLDDRNRQEDTQRILLASINNYEASTEILEKKIFDVKEQIQVRAASVKGIVKGVKDGEGGGRRDCEW